MNRIANHNFHRVNRILSTPLQSFWHWLPISVQVKLKIKGFIFNYFSIPFRGSGMYRRWQSFNSNCQYNYDIQPAQRHEKEPPGNEYVPILKASPLIEKPVSLICFYLPQFHAIPENDVWWGKGFTEWKNVKSAKPLFKGHDQPRIPGELGYYNLLDNSVIRRQIELAKLYGIEGFCFYYYWFNGKRLLEKPIENFINDETLKFPFCLCWANENWTRRWDGLENQLLISQNYSPEDDIEFIKHIARYLNDSRYIRINGSPLLLVYRPNLLPSPKDTTKRWRQWCRDNGVGDIYLAYTQSFEKVNPSQYGFDAAIEFPPNNSAPPDITETVKPITRPFACSVFDWETFIHRSRQYKKTKYKLFRGVCPSWDNTPRRRGNGIIFGNSSPHGYQEWLYNSVIDTVMRLNNPDERLVFVNAWNEWAEGSYLEPDQTRGYAYLEATRLALVRSGATISSNSCPNKSLAVVIHAFYEDIFEELISLIDKVDIFSLKLYVTTTTQKQKKIKTILSKQKHSYVLMTVENKGRDILPFLKIMPTVLKEKHAFVLKIHTKKSQFCLNGDQWRKELIEQLASDKAITESISYLKSNPEVGLLGPNGHLIPMEKYYGSNKKFIINISNRLGVNTEVLNSLCFVAGSMFFARTKALLPLLNLAIPDSYFSEETGQTDGTFAHAIERLFSVSAHASGLITTCKANKITNTYEFANYMSS